MFSVPLTNQQVFSDDASTLSTGQREHPGIFSPATDHIQPPPPKATGTARPVPLFLLYAENIWV